MKKNKGAACVLAAAITLSSCTDISDGKVSLTQQGVAISAVTETAEPEHLPPSTRATVSAETIAAVVKVPESAEVSETDEVPETSDITDTSDSPKAYDISEASGKSGTVTVAFAGDVTQSDVFGDVTRYNGLDYSLGDVAPIFSAADIAFVNLETSVSERGTSEKREGYGFRTEPERLGVFTSAGIDIVSTANNHVRDFGMDALMDTFENLDKYGLDYVGAGKDLSTAEKLIVYEKNGLKIGFTACNCFIENSTWYASSEQAGINCVDIGGETAERYLAKIKEYDSQCDVLFVSVHWGIEYFHGASDEQKMFAHQLCDSGADIILGHHPHVLEPIENYGGKLIFYSLGNFLFYKMDDYAGHTAIFTVEADKNGFVSGRLQPVNIDYCRSNLLKEGGELYGEIISLVNDMSADSGVYIDENGGINLK